MLRAKQSKQRTHHRKAHLAQLLRRKVPRPGLMPTHISRRLGTNRVVYGQCRIWGHHRVEVHPVRICRDSTSPHRIVRTHETGVEAWGAKVVDSSKLSRTGRVVGIGRVTSRRRVGWASRGESPERSKSITTFARKLQTTGEDLSRLTSSPAPRSRCPPRRVTKRRSRILVISFVLIGVRGIVGCMSRRNDRTQTKYHSASTARWIRGFGEHPGYGTRRRKRQHQRPD